MLTRVGSPRRSPPHLAVPFQVPLAVHDVSRLAALEQIGSRGVTGRRRHDVIGQLQIADELQRSDDGRSRQGGLIRVIQGPAAVAADPRHQPEGLVQVVDQAILPARRAGQHLELGDPGIGISRHLLHQLLVVHKHQVVAVVVGHRPKRPPHHGSRQRAGEELVEHLSIEEPVRRLDNAQLAEHARKIAGARQIGRLLARCGLGKRARSSS